MAGSEWAKMRVLHLVKTNVGATWAWRQIRELVKLGLDVHVAIPAGGPMAGKYAAVGAHEHNLQTNFPVGVPWRFPSLAAEFRMLVNAVNPDIIHSHFVGTTLTMRFSLGRNHPIPRVFQVPGPLHLEHPFFRIAEITTAGNADSWIGSCVWTCNRYQKSGVPKNRVYLSYYGTDLDLFKKQPKGLLRKELGLSESIKVVGMVAFMYRPKSHLGQTRGIKGHEDLIDAFALCLRQDADMRCVFVGGAWDGASAYEAKIKAYARQQCGDKAVFLGNRLDVPLLYPDFDVVVHPSHSENVGGACESLLMAVPTISTNVGGFPDLVKNGETGWLIPPRDPVQLSRAIMEALQNRDEACQRAERGRILARDLFDVEKTALRIMEIYEQILTKRTSIC